MTAEYFDVLTLLLPTLWAIIASCLAILLYRTSASFFESSDRSKGRVRRLRLAGSVVIALLLFYAMQRATPETRLASERAQHLRTLASQQDRATLRLAACVATRSDSCRAEVDEVRSLANQLVKFSGAEK